MERDLNAALMKAHENLDHAKLIDLYVQIGEEKLSINDIDAACFYFTHAYVFALESGSSKARELNQQLVKFGREVEDNL